MDKHEILENLYHHTPEATEADDRTKKAELVDAMQTFRSRVFVQGKSEVISKTVITVPSNKKLIIEFITAEIRIEDASDLTGVYFYSQWPVTHFLIPTKVYNYYPSKVGPLTDRWLISQPTGLVAGPKEKIRVVATKSNILGNMQATFTLFGHYEDL